MSSIPSVTHEIKYRIDRLLSVTSWTSWFPHIYMHLQTQHAPADFGQACLHSASSTGNLTRAPNVLTTQKLIGFKKRSARAQQPTRGWLCHVTRTPSAKEARTRSRDCYVTTPTPGQIIFLELRQGVWRIVEKALRNMIKQPLSPLPVKWEMVFCNPRRPPLLVFNRRGFNRQQIQHKSQSKRQEITHINSSGCLIWRCHSSLSSSWPCKLARKRKLVAHL